MTKSFANIAAKGDKIRAHDFNLPPYRKACYYEGLVIDASSSLSGGYSSFMVKVDKRVFDGAEIAVHTGTVFVPHETSMDWDGRVELIGKAD